MKGRHVQRAGVAQRRIGGAWRERLVHVHEIERNGAEHLLDRARDVERHRRGRQARVPAAGHIKHLAHGEHTGGAGIGALEELPGILARLAQQPPARTHGLAGARGRQYQDAMATRRELAAELAHVSGQIAALRLQRKRADVGDREPWRGHAAIIAPAVKLAAGTERAASLSAARRSAAAGRDALGGCPALARSTLGRRGLACGGGSARAAFMLGDELLGIRLGEVVLGRWLCGDFIR